jgi:hypothetical protein
VALSKLLQKNAARALARAAFFFRVGGDPVRPWFGWFS